MAGAVQRSELSQAVEHPQVVPLGPKAQQSLGRLIALRDMHAQSYEQVSRQIGEIVAAIQESLGLDESWVLADVATGFVKREAESQ